MLNKPADFIRSLDTEAGRRAFWNLCWLGGSTGFSYLCNFLVLIMLTHGLPPDHYGILVTGLTIQSYLILIGSVCSGSVLMREGARRPADLDKITSAYLLLTCGCSSLAVAGAWVWTFATVDAFDERWMIALLAVSAIPAAVSLVPLFDLHHHQNRYVRVNLVVELIVLGTIFASVRLDLITLPLIGAVYVGKMAMMACGHFWVYSRTIRRVRWNFAFGELRVLWRSSWPLLIAAAAFMIPLNSGIFFIRQYSGDSQAAIYGLSCQIATAAYAFAGLGVQVIQPHAMGQYGLTKSFIGKLAVFFVLFLLAIGLLAIAGSWVLIQYFLQPVYREAFVPAASLVIVALLMTLNRIPHIYLLRCHREGVIVAMHVGGAVVYAITCVLLAPSGGIPAVLTITLGVTFLALLTSLAVTVKVVRQHVPSYSHC